MSRGGGGGVTGEVTAGELVTVKTADVFKATTRQFPAFFLVTKLGVFDQEVAASPASLVTTNVC